MLDQNRFEKFCKSRGYRASYTSHRVRSAIATQIYALREQFSGTQTEFSKLIDKPQSVVSRLENPDYGNVSVKTLLEVAEALDITLVIKFMSFDDFFDHFDDADLDPGALRVEPFSATAAKRLELQKPEGAHISKGLKELAGLNDSNHHVVQLDDFRPKPPRITEVAYQKRSSVLSAASASGAA